MKRLAIIMLSSLAVFTAIAQSKSIQDAALPQRENRNRTIYISPIKSYYSYFVSLGYEQSFRLTRKKWTAARLNFVISPNILWSGYNHEQESDDTLPESQYEKWELSVPLLLRFEITPFRILKGSSPGRNDYNAAAFLETGLMFNYLLSAHLTEHFNYGGGSFRYTFDGPITDYAASKVSSHYLAFGIGFRINRFSMAVRDFQPISPTKYQDISTAWGLPPGVKSFFFSEFPNDPFLNQGIVLLCLGYSF
jgi:hypothetical protein